MGSWVELRLPDGREMFDAEGKLTVYLNARPENFIYGVPAVIVDDVAHEVIAAPAAGIRIYVTSILITNDDATVGTVVTLKDGTTAIFQGNVPAVNGQISKELNIPLKLTAATALNAICATTGASVYISVVGYLGV